MSAYTTTGQVEVDEPGRNALWWLDHLVPSPDEWHSAVLGWCSEMLEEYSLHLSDKTLEMLAREVWWYECGRVLGIWTRRGLKLGGGLLVALLLYRSLKR